MGWIAPEMLQEGQRTVCFGEGGMSATMRYDGSPRLGADPGGRYFLCRLCHPLPAAWHTPVWGVGRAPGLCCDSAGQEGSPSHNLSCPAHRSDQHPQLPAKDCPPWRLSCRRPHSRHGCRDAERPVGCGAGWVGVPGRPASSSFLLRMRSISATQALHHPFLWSAKRKLVFLMDVSDRVEKVCPSSFNSAWLCLSPCLPFPLLPTPGRPSP